MARKNFGDGALRLIDPTTETGVGFTASISPVQTVTAQVVGTSGATGTVLVQGSLDGAAFFTAIAATTFITSTAGGIATFITSTSTHIFTQLRPNLTVTGTTEDISVFIAGR